MRDWQDSCAAWIVNLLLSYNHRVGLFKPVERAVQTLPGSKLMSIMTSFAELRTLGSAEQAYLVVIRVLIHEYWTIPVINFAVNYVNPRPIKHLVGTTLIDCNSTTVAVGLCNKSIAWGQRRSQDFVLKSTSHSSPSLPLPFILFRLLSPLNSRGPRLPPPENSLT